MSLSSDFSEFCTNIKLDNLNVLETTAGEIAKKLNKHYYDLDKDTSSHLYIVGSVGRKTAIKGSSDLDIIFNLPDEVFKRFDDYESGGQSALLQEVKNVLIDRYPKTKIRGDGQVVVIEFTSYMVEVVPAFMQSDNRFKYPDTHDGGSWKITDPLREQEECLNCNETSNGIYFDFCHIIRAWKNKVGFKFGGLLIDTLVYNHFKEKDYYSESGFDDYLTILKNIFSFLKNCNKEQKYWLAVGSNQQVSNTDNGAFVSKAKKAYKKITEAENNENDINTVLRDLLGKDFPQTIYNCYESASYSHTRYNDTEQFIEDVLPIDIKYNLKLDCSVTQNGWEKFLLSYALKNKTLLRKNRSLEFFIDATDCPKPYNIYWKVRNVGEKAEELNQIRGEIFRTNNNCQKEKTSFEGAHFVECYLEQNGVCVARARIDVPIGKI